MQIGQSLDYTSRIELGLTLLEAALLAQQRPQLAAQTGFEQQVQILLVLEGLVETAYERRTSLYHDVPLV